MAGNCRNCEIISHDDAFAMMKSSVSEGCLKTGVRIIDLFFFKKIFELFHFICRCLAAKHCCSCFS